VSPRAYNFGFVFAGKQHPFFLFFRDTKPGNIMPCRATRVTSPVAVECLCQPGSPDEVTAQSCLREGVVGKANPFTSLALRPGRDMGWDSRANAGHCWKRRRASTNRLSWRLSTPVPSAQSPETPRRDSPHLYKAAAVVSDDRIHSTDLCMTRLEQALPALTARHSGSFDVGTLIISWFSGPWPGHVCLVATGW
jgi:hypothetical protein